MVEEVFEALVEEVVDLAVGDVVAEITVWPVL
jgi:hypothetical protein